MDWVVDLIAQVRTTRIIRETFAALASAQTPLILFLDDLQWFDGASLDVAKALLARVPAKDKGNAEIAAICGNLNPHFAVEPLYPAPIFPRRSAADSPDWEDLTYVATIGSTWN